MCEVGSQAVAQEYARKGTVVRAMLQMDMTAWYATFVLVPQLPLILKARRVKAGTKPTFGVITDFVDPEFTQFIRQLIEAYGQCLLRALRVVDPDSLLPAAEIGWTDTKCGYACSDHVRRFFSSKNAADL